jgi:hypothetical protein
MHKMLLEISARIESGWIYLHSYEAGDGQRKNDGSIFEASGE